MDKLTMAHDWAMRCNRTDLTMKGFVDLAWSYADAMQAEADKRNYSEKQDSSEWQPDWSVAPESADYWAMDENGWCNWYSKEHEVIGTQWDWDDVFKSSSSFNYQGNWQNSLRKRPQ